MKAPLWIVAVCFYLLPTISSAGDDSYEWVLKQYDTKNDSVMSSEEGQLDGDQFLAIIAKREMGPLLAVFRRGSTRYVGVGQMDLPDSPPSLSTVAIAKNSCRHGQGMAHGDRPSARDSTTCAARACQRESRRWACTRMLVSTAITPTPRGRRRPARVGLPRTGRPCRVAGRARRRTHPAV